MNALRAFAIAGVAAVCTAALVPHANAGIVVGIGPAPVCPYGYYPYPPYACAPYGYYGPEWFVNGIFIGAGPWFHGPAGFHGYVDHRFGYDHGYRGPFPHRGERPARPLNHMRGFHGDEMRDGRGHVIGRR